MDEHPLLPAYRRGLEKQRGTIPELPADATDEDIDRLARQMLARHFPGVARRSPLMGARLVLRMMQDE